MSQEADILRARSLINRNLYQQRIADATEAQLEQSQPTSYLNFDASTGLARLQDLRANIVYGAAQTNGAIALGENIRLRRGGVIAGYDAMPRKKPIINDKKIINESYRVKTLFYLLNLDGINLDIYIGGYAPSAKIVESELPSVGGYITNLGKTKSLVSLKYTKDDLRTYLFRKFGQKEPLIITNPIKLGDEYYLGNGLWESSSSSPTRNMIHDLQIHNFPVNIVEKTPRDSYGRSLNRNEVEAQASTWTPENPNSIFSFTRNLVNYVYDKPDPTAYPLRGLGVSYIFQNTISFSFIYPDESYTFPDGGKSRFSLQINGGTFDTLTGIVTAQPAIFYLSLKPISNSSPTNVASVPDGAYFPGNINDFLYTGARQDYSNWLAGTISSVRLADGTYPLLGLEVHNSDGTTTITYTFPNGITLIYGFIPTPPLPLVPTDFRLPVIEENYLEKYSGVFLVQQTTDGYLYQEWAATRKIKLAAFADPNDNKLIETKNVITLRIKPDIAIVLDNSDFLVILGWDSLSPINKDSTTFTLISIQSYNKNFNFSTAIGQPVLFNTNIDNFPALIRGIISNAVYSLAGKLTLSVSISKISLKTATSFFNRLITDNGSYYSYHFCKQPASKWGKFLNKSVLPVIPLNPITSSFPSEFNAGLLNETTAINLRTDSWVGKKIYSVNNTTSSKADIEEWDILADGKVKFTKIFTTPYRKIPKGSIVLSHSFHP